MALDVTGALLPRSGISRAVLVPHLRRLRLRAGMSQAILAKRAGVSRETVRRGEAGEEIRISNVAKLAAALKCAPSDLMPADLS